MDRFSPVIHPWNQDVWQALTLEPERSNHALLFVGAKGLGKRDIALGLAHFVITELGGQSESLFSAGSHPDLHVLMVEAEIEENLVGEYAQRYTAQHSGKPKQSILIDQVRTLSQSITTHPHISKNRVILIFGVEEMNRNAANAVLKNLEEPPANTLFILVCDDPSKLMPTIRSRCSLIPFRSPDRETATKWLSMSQSMPQDEIDKYLALASGQPLTALEFMQSNYLDELKSVFTDVNALFAQSLAPVSAAKNWEKIGSNKCLDILQKLAADLMKAKLTDQAKGVFFPVQWSWIRSVSRKISNKRLQGLIDELHYSKKMLNTTVDKLLVMENLGVKLSELPKAN